MCILEGFIDLWVLKPVKYTSNKARIPRNGASLFSAKYMPPIARWPSFRSTSIQQAASSQGTLFVIPPGCMSTEGLVAVLQEQMNAILWLRMDSANCDPACCLLDITYAAQRLNPQLGASTLNHMQRAPGPVFGWQPLFKNLGEELGASLATEIPVVLYGIPQVSNSQPALVRYISSFLESLPQAVRYILISHQALPECMLPEGICIMGAESLGVDEGFCGEQAKSAGIKLSEGCRRRVVKLAGGFAPMLSGILEAGCMLGTDYLEELVQRAANQERLLGDIIRTFLSGASPETRYAMFLALRLGFYHPDIGEAIWDRGEIDRGPWMQPLLDNWYHLRWGWRKPLESTLRLDAGVQRELLHRAANHLAENRAPDMAVPIFLDLKDYPRAVQVIESRLEEMMNYGQWVTLKDWMDRIPENILRDWPWLVYARAEIQAVDGSMDQARGDFASAYQLFSMTQDMQGLCQSLLAESALAVRQGDFQMGQNSALQAFFQAQSEGLPWLIAWAFWQLGCLAMSTDNIDYAVECFGYAVQCSDGSLVSEIIHRMETIAQQYQALTHEFSYHREAYQSAKRAMEEKKQDIMRVLSRPMEDLPCLLEMYGWWKIPPMLKLPAAYCTPQEDEEPDLGARIRGILRVLGLDLRTTGSREKMTSLTLPLGGYPLSPLGRWRTPPQEIPGKVSDVQDLDPTGPVQIDSITEPQLPLVEDNKKQSPVSSTRVPKLRVYCLGLMQVYQDEKPVEDWTSSKSKAIFKYLVTHRERPIPKEVLMELFWPDTHPDAARNNLNVAVYGLRQALRATHPSYSHILFQSDCYLINPEIEIWLDCECFTQQFTLAQSMEQSGDLQGAVEVYTRAEALYGGDFLEEDRYEDWVVLLQHYYRDAYLQILNYLGSYFLAQEDHQACIQFTRKVVSIEPCDEEAHRRLMCCYKSLGQPHLARRQFQICKKNLKEQLGVVPSEETIGVYESLYPAMKK